MWWKNVGVVCFFFQAEDGIRDLVRSRGLGDVYKRQRDCGRDCSRDGCVIEGSFGFWVERRFTVGDCPDRLSLIHI